MPTSPKTNMEGPKMMVWKRWTPFKIWLFFAIYVRFLGCNPREQLIQKDIPKKHPQNLPHLFLQTVPKGYQNFTPGEIQHRYQESWFGKYISLFKLWLHFVYLSLNFRWVNNFHLQLHKISSSGSPIPIRPLPVEIEAARNSHLQTLTSVV